MKKGGLLLGIKTGIIALCLAASIPFSANAATVVKPDGTGLDESKMTQEEKEGYELTKKYSKTSLLSYPDILISLSISLNLYSISAISFSL